MYSINCRHEGYLYPYMHSSIRCLQVDGWNIFILFHYWFKCLCKVLFYQAIKHFSCIFYLIYALLRSFFVSRIRLTVWNCTVGISYSLFSIFSLLFFLLFLISINIVSILPTQLQFVSKSCFGFGLNTLQQISLISKFWVCRDMLLANSAVNFEEHRYQQH